MFYYIKIKKELEYILSEPFSTQELAKEKLNTYDDKQKKNSSIILLPEIKLGLVLYVNGNYYKTIVGESSTLYFLKKDVNYKNTMSDFVQKTSLINWFIEEKVDTIEEYNTNIDFHIVSDLFGKSDITYTEED